jgi:hypothetical protein
MFVKYSITMIAPLLILTACSTYSHSVQVDDKAYLLLIGEPDGALLTIDNGRPIDLDKNTTSYELHGKTATKIQVSIGSHSVKVIRDGILVINRNFYVSTGTSFEVEL